MPTILQLNPPLPLNTPKGPGLAHFLIDYGAEFNLMWTVFLDESNECWTFQNPEIRAQRNPTFGRPNKVLPQRAVPTPVAIAVALPGMEDRCLCSDQDEDLLRLGAAVPG